MQVLRVTLCRNSVGLRCTKAQVDSGARGRRGGQENVANPYMEKGMLSLRGTTTLHRSAGVEGEGRQGLAFLAWPRRNTLFSTLNEHDQDVGQMVIDRKMSLICALSPI